ncbi:hypothetical protein SNE40_000740 [Patella caerulea]|uniref:EGF-like domain-containing protein n=1 Tax=Patella caerulea TaxID=87958 RepID=A0AAN8KEG7_PATCE
MDKQGIFHRFIIIGITVYYYLSLPSPISCQTDINFCKNDSCENGGSCYEQDTDYGCNCSNEWTGRNCNILVNSSCNDVPCKNGGSCQTINLTTSSGVIESFNCTCMDGYHGPTCEQMIDLCVDVPCSNNATCNPLPSTYQCICQPGFTGVRCETNIDDCTSNGCEYGDCQDGLNGYYCNCTEGWTGKYCNEDVDECNTTTPCQRGVCINTQGGFYCNCNGTGYNGTNCADEVDECSLVPAQCKNGANCTNTEGSYNCSCTLGYTGDDCDIPDCNANQCENNSTCQVKDQKWMCKCLEYYFGDQCETAGPCTYGYCDDINTNICQQDEVTMNYTCVCKQGWEGENCTKDIDECLIPSTCLNGATCNNLNGSYTCDCVPGYTGYNCGSDINECLTPNLCLNGGTCNDYLNYFNCTCTAGYKGDLCGEDVDECLSTPCKNNQPCINSEGSFSCNCSENYLGNLCQHNNPCDVETCQNGGLCKTNVTEDNNYVPFCECVNGYEGARCERADPSKQPVDDSVNIWAIIGPIIAILVIIIIIVAVVFFRMARKKRATRGQYCPSQQENAGARVELGNVLKKPPQERLI